MRIGERVLLPRTELRVSRLCLGGNRFGGGLDREASFAVLDAYREAGGNFLDTAHVYADWIPGNIRSSSETMIGRWIKDRNAAGMVVATKGGHPPLDAPSQSRLDRQSLRRDVTESLGCLQVERLDLFYLHRDDPSRDVAEILGVLEELASEGLIHAYAASNWTLPRLEEAARVAEAEGWRGFVASQAEWSFAERNPASSPADLVQMDEAMIRAHREWGWAAMPYSAQAKGYFDKIAAGALQPDSPAARLYDSPGNRGRAAVLAGVAEELGATPTQVALAALLAAPFPTVPVIGCGSPQQVRASLDSLSLTLESRHLARLSEAAPWLAAHKA